jgi:hypothetical protein
MIDRLEKAGRTVLWFAIAIGVLAYLGETLARDRAIAKAAEEAKAQIAKERAELAKEKLSKKATRLALASMGTVFQGLEGSLGHVWFTNASEREGVVCARGTASNGHQSIESLVACGHVDAYESNVKLNLMFAGSDMKELCLNSPCSLDVKDAAEKPQAVAAK